MKLKAVIFDICSGGPLVVTLNHETAHSLGLFPGNRVKLSSKGKYIIAVLDISRNIKKNQIGVLAEANRKLKLNKGELVSVEPEDTPSSLLYIKKKLDGKKLSKDEIFAIVDDIVDNMLTESELTYFISAAYTKGFSLDETENLIKAMSLSGEIIKWRKKKILDKHCTGGVPGNRTTPLVVSIVAAAGLDIPKTSSRAITSPSGTADTIEVLTNVEIDDSDELKRIVKRTGGCMIWGGALNLAPADDKIIRIEKPLSLDPTPMLLSSILAKKYAVGATDVLIDIPVGSYGKVSSISKYKELRRKFRTLGKRLKMNIEVVKTNAIGPIGRGLGPALEARDIFWILENDDRAPTDLREKSILLSGKLLEMGGVANKNNGEDLARNILDSGKALRKFKEILKAQGSRPILSSKGIKIGGFYYEFRAEKAGEIHMMKKQGLSISRLSGAPSDKGAGIYINKKIGDKVEEGDLLFTVYAECQRKLDEAVSYAIDNFPILIK